MSMMNIVGLGDEAYEQWLQEQASRVLGVQANAELAVCWGTMPPPQARAAVLIPRNPAFRDNIECLREWFVAPPATESLIVDRLGVPTVQLELDVISWFGWLLSRSEEYNGYQEDAHGRFPRSAALMEQLGLLEIPIADRLMLRLRRALEVVAQAAGVALRRNLPWPEGKMFAVCLTHDVDLAPRRSARQFVRKAIGAAVALLQGSLANSRRRFSEAIGLATGSRYSPHRLSETMAEIEGRYGFRSAFYLLPLETESAIFEGGQSVIRYDLRRPELRTYFRQLAAHGWELGLHTNYDAHNAPGGLQADWERLDRILGKDIELMGARSHYLRFRVPKTWTEESRCGMLYDSSLGLAQGYGFRSGTSWPYQPFDHQTGQMIRIWEISLHLMDGALPCLQDMVEGVQQVLCQVAEVGGCACFLFHPAVSDPGATVPEFIAMYEEVVKLIATRPDAWVTTPGAIVQRIASF